MKILGIESASDTASVSIVENSRVIAEYTMNYRKTHSQTLLPMIDEIVSRTETDLSQIDAIAVSGGPGSYTGLRIGSATAKGLGLALGKPLLHIPTLEAMAYQLAGYSGLICPMLDARRENVFAGIYSWSGGFHVVEEPAHASVLSWVEKLNQSGEPCMFLGDGAQAWHQLIQDNCRVPFEVAPVFASQPRAAAVAALGMEYFIAGKTESAAEHKPDYLRKSQAEQELESRS